MFEPHRKPKAPNTSDAQSKSAALVLPGSLDDRTGGYIYDRHIVDGLRAMGWSVDVHQLHDSFPRPTPAALQQASEVFGALRSGTVTLVDSLALGAMPDVIGGHAARLVIVALVHLPLAADIGVDEQTAARVAAAEQRALAATSRVIVTGHATLAMLDRYQLESSRIVVVEPGTDPAPIAKGSGRSEIGLISVATLNPGKGHLDLLSALAAVPCRAWHLMCVGSLIRHPATVDRVRSAIHEQQLDDRVTLVGELDEQTLATHYDRSDVFVLATHRETYGMAVAEALARGLPVVSTLTGAIPQLVGTDAGLLVAPGDVPALTSALSEIISDAALRTRLAEGARRAGLLLPRWSETVARMSATLESLVHG